MKFWAQWSAKIDELSLRERALVFLAIAAALVLAVHTIAIQPLLRESRRYVERINQDQAQLASINEALLKSAKGVASDPNVAKRERIRALENQLAATERVLAERRKTELSPAQLTRVLQDVVGRGRNLRLDALRVLPAAPLAAAPGAPAPKTAPLYRHGLEVEVTGTYPELLRYLEEVEKLPWRLTWSSVDLKTTKYPEVHLKATVSTLSTSPTLITF